MPERSQWSWTGLNTGFWAAVLSAVWTAWFFIAFGVWLCATPARLGSGAFSVAFDSVGYLLWVIPCLLLTMTLPVLMAAVYLYLPSDRKAPALVALVFACLYGAVLGATYFVLVLAARAALSGGAVDGAELLIAGSPYSVVDALEGAGYLFVGLAIVFAGLAWRVPGKWRRVTRWLLIFDGVACIVGVVVAVLGWATGSTVFLGIWAGTFPVAAVLLAVRFNQDLRVAPVSNRVIRV